MSSRRSLAKPAGTTANPSQPAVAGGPTTCAGPGSSRRHALLRGGLLALALGALALAVPAAASATYVFESKWGSGGAGAGQFSSPGGVATDSSGNIYVADRDNNRIQKFSSAGVFVATWGFGVDDGIGVFQICTTTCEAGIAGNGAGQLANPAGIAIDSSDNVYVADTNNSRIQKFTSAGAIVTEWGSAGTAEGEFANPQGLAIDSSDNVYVAIDVNHRIQKFDSNGTFLATWGFGVDDGTAAFQVCTITCQAGINGAGDGQFSFPLGVATGPDGVVYVADSNNSRIQKFNSSGTFLTKWGTNGAGNGQFFQPFRVTTDASGSVYVADTFNNRMQKFDSTGTILAKWGSPGAGDGQFSFPVGVTTDASGSVYVVGFGNNRIQEFAPAPPTTTISSGPADPTSDNTPSFGFATDPLDLIGGSLDCRLDAQPFAPCTSPFTSPTLPDGPHSFEVRATDNEGVEDPPARRDFTVDATIPDTTVAGSASAKKTQKQKGKKVVVKVKVTADEDLAAKGTGKVKVGKKSYKLKPKTADAAAGTEKNLTLKPKKAKDRKKIAKALKQGTKAKAKLTVKLTDELGNPKTQKLSVKLTR